MIKSRFSKIRSRVSTLEDCNLWFQIYKRLLNNTILPMSCIMLVIQIKLPSMH